MGDMEKKVDSLFSKLQKRVTGTISAFVAYFFFMIALGSFITVVVITQWPQHTFWVIIAPLLAGVLAYYNRAFATAIFLLILIGLLLI